MKEKPGITPRRRLMLVHALTGLLRELGWIGSDERIEAEFRIMKRRPGRTKSLKKNRAG